MAVVVGKVGKSDPFCPYDDGIVGATRYSVLVLVLVVVCLDVGYSHTGQHTAHSPHPPTHARPTNTSLAVVVWRRDAGCRMQDAVVCVVHTVHHHGP
jgi:hypothetical protein